MYVVRQFFQNLFYTKISFKRIKIHLYLIFFSQCAINNFMKIRLLQLLSSFFFINYFILSIFFWLGKDFAWNHEIKFLWIIFAIPTLLISFDFVYVSLTQNVSTTVPKHYCLVKSNLPHFFFICFSDIFKYFFVFIYLFLFIF